MSNREKQKEFISLISHIRWCMERARTHRAAKGKDGMPLNAPAAYVSMARVANRQAVNLWYGREQFDGIVTS